MESSSTSASSGGNSPPQSTGSVSGADTGQGASRDSDIVFFDGTCGLCHGSVKFLLARDGNGASAPNFRFAPLQGETFLEQVPDDQRDSIPDSLVVLTRDGQLLFRSRAVLYSLRHLSRPWKAIAVIGGCVPRALLDLLYRCVALVRTRLLTKPDSLCPILPPHLRRRFLP